MPALNEAGVIGETLRGIPDGFVDAVYVGDNGSTDGTAAEAEAHGARVVPAPRRGYGAACHAVLEAMERGSPPDVVVFVDADGSQPIDELERLLRPIGDGRADLVLGARRSERLPAHVSVGNRVACLILYALTGRWFRDLGPFRAIRYRSLRDLGLADRDYGWNVEMQARALAAGLRVLEVPVSHRPRLAGRSKISGSIGGTLRAGSKILWMAVREGWRARRALGRRWPGTPRLEEGRAMADREERELARESCTPCRGDVPPLEEDEARRLAADVPEWDLLVGASRIRRRLELPSFAAVIDLVEEIAEVAEAEGHHPDLEIRGNELVVTLYTHAIDGLHLNDFIMAAKIDELV